MNWYKQKSLNFGHQRHKHTRHLVIKARQKVGKKMIKSINLDGLIQEIRW